MSTEINAQVISINDEERWNDLLFNSLYPSYIRNLSFEYSQQFNDREIVSYIFSKDNEDIAAVNYSIKRSWGNLISISDILSGFAFKNQPTEELLGFLVDHYINWAKSNRLSYIRISPWLPKTIAGKETEYVRLFNRIFFDKGFSNIRGGRHTYWIDLTLSEEELFKKMNSQTKRNIQKGLKSDIFIEEYNNLNNELLELFWSLYDNLGNNKGFDTLNKPRFEYEVLSLMKSGLATLFVLRFKGEIINIALASNFGVATYYHGALNPEYKKIENCPSPGHFSQWHIIKYMKSKGLKIYDMAFCPGPSPIKDHPQIGIWQFKYGFGGNHVEFMPIYGKVLDPISGSIFKIIKYRK